MIVAGGCGFTIQRRIKSPRGWRQIPRPTTSPLAAMPTMVSLRVFGKAQGDIPQMILASRSKHSGGVVVVKCDVSAEFISDDIDLNVWRSQSTMAGSDPPLTAIDPEGNGQ